MVVVSSPSSTPIVTYSRDGITIDDLIATGSTFADSAPILRYSQVTVVMVNASSSSNGVSLPSTSEIGDLIEIHRSFSGVSSFQVYDDAGNFIWTGGGAVFRKITSSTWARVASGGT